MAGKLYGLINVLKELIQYPVQGSAVVPGFPQPGLIQTQVGFQFDGYSAASTSFVDIYAQGSVSGATTRTQWAAAVKVNVTSSSGNDTALGSGARTVWIQGLDSGYNNIGELITLNGQTAVVSTLSYLRVNSAYVVTCGTGAANAGVIYVADSADVPSGGVPQTAAYFAIAIPAGDMVSKATTWTVPAGLTMMVTNVKTWYQDVGGTLRYGYWKALQSAGSGYAWYPLIGLGGNLANSGPAPDCTLALPIIVNEKQDFKIQALNSGSTVTQAVVEAIYY